jgi:hypothetical protein
MDQAIMSPIFQYGFAGFAAVQLVILVWVIKRVLDAFTENTKVIANNTNAIVGIGTQITALTTLVGELRDKIITLECVKDKK